MSYRKIFTVVNGHTVSTVMARYAIALAAACKAELVLYACHDKVGDDTDRHLEHLTTVAAKMDIPVTRIIESGNIRTLLPKRVQAEQGDLVFFPLTSYRRYGADMQRHTVHHLLRTVKSDMVIMRVITMVKPHPARILVPLGKCAGNMKRRQMFVVELANCFHAQVTLFHLDSEPASIGMPEGITKFREQLVRQQVSVLERLGTGHIANAIAVEAVTHHNDLIVLGASERGVLQRLFFGNPAGDVMRQPPCNTLLFRHAPETS